MTNTEVVAKTPVKREKKLNVSYIQFLAALKQSRTAIVPGNRASIAAQYEAKTELRFTNLSRVSTRVQREELGSQLNVALRENKLTLPEFQKLDESVRAIISVKAE